MISSLPGSRLAAARFEPLATTAAGLLVVAAYYFLPAPGALGALVLFAVFAAVELPMATALTLAAAPFYLPNPSNPLPPKSFGAFQFTLVESLVLALFAGWLLRLAWECLARKLHRLGQVSSPRLLDWLHPATDRGIALLALLLLVLGALSIVLAKYQWVALREWRTVIVEPVLFFAVSRSVAQTEAGRTRLVIGLLVAALAVSAYVIGHYVLSGVVEETGGVARALGIYHSPNALALYLDRVLLFALAMALAWRGRTRRFALAAATILLGIAAIGLTFSRAAWLALAIGVAYVVFRYRRRAGLIVLAGLAVAALATASLLPSERLFGAETIERRLNVWQSAATLIAERPITGVGLDNFLYYYRDEGYLLPGAAIEPDISHPHNWVLDWWLRLGLPGLAVFVGLQIAFWRRIAAVPTSPIGLAMSGLMLVTLVHGLVDNHFFVVDLAYLFWLAMALASGEALVGGGP